MSVSRQFREWMWWRLFSRRAVRWDRLTKRIADIEFIVSALRGKTSGWAYTEELEMLKKELEMLKKKREALERKMGIYMPSA